MFKIKNSDIHIIGDSINIVHAKFFEQDDELFLKLKRGVVGVCENSLVYEINGLTLYLWL